MVTIRRATEHDVPWLFKCCEDFAKFYGSKISLAGNPTYGRAFLRMLTEKHLVLIGLKDNMPAGFIAGMITAHHFNPDIKQLAELLWWVSEEYRNSGVGMELFEYFLDYGKMNCDWITFTLEHNSPIKDSFLLERGFSMTEKAYLMECN
jgi:N-acetylglutamate synthase-like GNAT family acetyltransferase